ncbi:MAG: tryptophan-rich sensory protein [Oscillospiraceae bacterium]|nr:tryptophan-rich sensory protein [Oscillospiraceae bacterium]
MKKQKLTNLLLFIVGTELVGALSGIISGKNFKTFYQSLNQPPFAPPEWLFPVAWGILYAIMGISAYLIYQTKHTNKTIAFKIYLLQLFVNFLWSPVFFRFKSLTGATIIISILLILIIIMLISFWKINKKASLLNLPYLLWTTFATYLTIGILVLN